MFKNKRTRNYYYYVNWQYFFFVIVLASTSFVALKDFSILGWNELDITS